MNSAIVRENVALAPLTTLGIGGPAEFFVRVQNLVDLSAALKFANSRSLAVTVLGGGSNLVVHDRGVSGLVVHVAFEGIDWRDEDDATAIAIVAAGENWDAFVRAAVERGLTGVECLSGIPGLVGGTPIQNVGAYGQEVADTIVRVHAIDRATLTPRVFSHQECGFTYRDSRFKSDLRSALVVTAVEFRLRRGTAPSLGYGELTRHFEGRTPNVAEVRDAVISLRRSKSMVLDPADENGRSAGSFFTNPIVPSSVADSVDAVREGLRLPVMPRFVAPLGCVKLAAGWLIEHAGFKKGQRFGSVGISSRHALALVNHGSASSNDLIHAALEIKRGVETRFGVVLVPEPEFVGFTDTELAPLRANAMS